MLDFRRGIGNIDGMSEPERLVSGDRVVHRDFGIVKHGTIKKVTKVTALVSFDDGTEDRVNLSRCLKRETAEDVFARDAKAAMKAWRDAQPKCPHLGHNTQWGGKITGVSMNAVTADDMRAAAAELLEFAAWFEKKPGDDR